MDGAHGQGLTHTNSGMAAKVASVKNIVALLIEFICNSHLISSSKLPTNLILCSKAMDFISPVIDIVSLLFDPIARRIRYALKLQVNMDSLENAMKDLKGVRNDVKTKVDVAERQLLVAKGRVKRWLERVKAIEREVNGMKEAYQQMRRCLGNCRPNCWSAYKLSKRAEKKLTDVAKLKSEGDSFDVVAEKPPPETVEVQPSTSVLGMDSTLKKVRGYLREDSVGVVGIYGMGGVGKTTLLKKINNEKTRGRFNVVIWVVVSNEDRRNDEILGRIKKKIGKRLGLIREEDRSNDDIPAARILKALSKMKFMLLLDDIWQPLDLDKIGIPHPSSQNKCKVVFTTRFENVCYKMKADKKVKIKCLGRKEAWDLFRENVGEEALNSCGDIRRRAKPIANECGGLPLMLITIGRAMASKKTPEEWENAKTALKASRPADISGADQTEVFFRSLKFSYDSLRGDIIKSCFLYCSLFPEDYDISKEDLIDYWIGEGFLDEEGDDLNSARNKGHDIIGALKSACLLESGYNEKTKVKMHDVIRDLALWISSECGKKKNKFLVKAGVGVGWREAPAIERWTEAKRISLMQNKIIEITETPNCRYLLTLMLQKNRSLKKITNEFFKFMPRLRVLDLSFSGIKEIPAGIGNLVELRYLNLSYTSITKLPKEIGCLTKLKHLDLSECHSLDGIPREAISRLSRLKVLKLLNSVISYKEVTEEMERLKWLSHLEITIKTVDDLKRYLDSDKLPKLTWALSIGIRKGLTTSTLLSSSFRAMRSIRRLNIVNCKEMEEMMIGGKVDNLNIVEKEDDHSVSSLESLVLWGLDNLNIIRVGECIQNLRHINISFCPKLKSVTWILQLQNLEEISIEICEGVEEVIGASDVRNPVRGACLRRLTSLRLSQLPKLRSICNHALAFPSLEKLYVSYCPKLKKLPIGLPSANNPLKEIKGAKEWWDGLKWEKDGIKSNLLPLFKETRR